MLFFRVYFHIYVCILESRFVDVVVFVVFVVSFVNFIHDILHKCAHHHHCKGDTHASSERVTECDRWIRSEWARLAGIAPAPAPAAATNCAVLLVLLLPLLLPLPHSRVRVRFHILSCPPKRYTTISNAKPTDMIFYIAILMLFMLQFHITSRTIPVRVCIYRRFKSHPLIASFSFFFFSCYQFFVYLFLSVHFFFYFCSFVRFFFFLFPLPPNIPIQFPECRHYTITHFRRIKITKNKSFFFSQNIFFLVRSSPSHQVTANGGGGGGDFSSFSLFGSILNRHIVFIYSFFIRIFSGYESR